MITNLESLVFSGVYYKPPSDLGVLTKLSLSSYYTLTGWKLNILDKLFLGFSLIIGLTGLSSIAFTFTPSQSYSLRRDKTWLLREGEALRRKSLSQGCSIAYLALILFSGSNSRHYYKY